MVTELTIPSVVYVAFRQRRVITYFLLFGLLITVAYCLVATARYEADASVVVNFNRQLSAPLSGDQGAVTATPTNADEILTSYTLVLQSNALAQKVIEEIGLANMYPKYVQEGPLSSVIGAVTRFLGISKSPMERAVDHFVTKDIDIQVAKDSTVLQITLLNPNPEIAKR